MSPVYETLSVEGKILLDETMARLDALYDDAQRLLRADRSHDYRRGHNVRASAHYALGLLIRGGAGDAARADAVIHAVIDTQFDCPEEIFHGTFRRDPAEPLPPVGALPWRDITLFNRYSVDVFYERLSNAFRKRLNAAPVLAARGLEIEEMLARAVLDEFPVVWLSYDPNWREFILSALALVVEHFAAVLPAATVARIDAAAKLALVGAIARGKSGFTPLNTNIEIMHVFIADYFGRRLGDAEAQRYALEYAEGFARRYFEHHAINEFNSPTYCGVDLTAIGYWRKFATQPRLRELGAQIEAGLWEDIADFYNPAMKNLCGPFSRNYDMDMSVHTSMHALLFLGLGAARFPDHPYNLESDHNPMLVLNGVEIPAVVQPRLLATGQERQVCRQFVELSERGDPRDNTSLCTATGWITDTLMTGALSGSRNVSGQLHPAVVYWRDAQGNVSSLRLRRTDTDGRNGFFHTVIFDAKADKGHIDIDVQSTVNRDVLVFFEFECGDLDSACIAPDCWQVSGLTVRVAPGAAQPTVTRTGNHLRVTYCLPDGAPETKRLHFALECSLDAAAGGGAAQ